MKTNPSDAGESEHRSQPETDIDRFFRIFSESSTDAVFLETLDGKIINCNPIACRLYGYTREELLTLTVADLVDPSVLPLLSGIVEQALRKGGFSLESQNRRRDGSLFPCLVTTRILPDSQPPILICCVRDLSRDREAINQLSATADRFWRMADNIRDGLTIVEDSRVVYINDRVCEILGYPREEIPRINMLQNVAPEDRRRVNQIYTDATTRGIFPPELEFWILRPDGSRRCIHNRYSVVQKEGHSSRFIVTTDVTERKRSEELQRLLYQITNTAHEAQTMEDLFTSIHGILGALLHTQNFFIALYDPENDTLSLPYFRDEKDKFDSFPAGRTMTGYLIHTNQPLLLYREDIDRMIREDIIDLVGTPAEVWLGVPMKTGDQIIGALVVQSYTDRHALGEKELDILKFVSGQIGFSIEHKRTDRALAEKEELFSNIVSSISDGIYVLDYEYRYTYCNPAYETIFGVSAQTLLSQSRPAWECIPVLERMGLTAPMRRAMAGEKVVIDELRYPCGDGQTRITTEILQPLKDHTGKVRGMVGLIRDITESKRSAEEINMLAHALRSIGECVSITDMQDRLIFVNDTFVETYGYTRDELLGQSIAMMRADEYMPPLEEINRQTLSEGNWRGELINRRKDGSLFPILLSSSVIYDDKDQPVAMIGVSRDISERKQLEEQLYQSQKLESIGQLAGGVAHDFNNLLSVITGYTDMLLNMVRSEDTMYKFILEIDKAGKRAADLTRQLLAFSRKQIIEPRIINLNSVIFDLIKMLNRLIGEDIKLELSLRDDIPPIKADPGQIEQIIINIIVNARDAIREKGDLAANNKITLTTRRVLLDDNYARLHIGTQAGEYIMLAISDTGCGITPEIQSKIFDPFFTTKGKTRGTGLGLATVYGIVKQNRGNIYVYSEPGQGSMFKIYWPLATPDEQPGATDASEAGLPTGHETILLVEDDHGVRDIAALTLRSLGYQVVAASNGEEALLMLPQIGRPVDLLFTDVIMPEMDGKTLAETIQRFYPTIKVLYASGYTDDHLSKTGVLEKNVAFINKPYSKESLAKKLRQVLDAAGK